MDKNPPIYLILSLIDTFEIPFTNEEEDFIELLHHQLLSSEPEKEEWVLCLLEPASCPLEVRVLLLRFHHAWNAQLPVAFDLIPSAETVKFVQNYLDWLQGTGRVCTRMVELADHLKQVFKEAWNALLHHSWFLHQYARDYCRLHIVERQSFMRWTHDDLKTLLFVLQNGSSCTTLQTWDTLLIVLQHWSWKTYADAFPYFPDLFLHFNPNKSDILRDSKRNVYDQYMMCSIFPEAVMYYKKHHT